MTALASTFSLQDYADLVRAGDWFYTLGALGLALAALLSVRRTGGRGKIASVGLAVIALTSLAGQVLDRLGVGPEGYGGRAVEQVLLDSVLPFVGLCIVSISVLNSTRRAPAYSRATDRRPQPESTSV